MNSERKSESRTLGRWLFSFVVTCALAILLVAGVGRLIISTVSESRAKRALAQMRLNPSQEASDKLLQILQGRHLNQKLGDEILKEIVKPTILIREKYLVGNPVVVGVDHQWTVNARDSFLKNSYKVIRGKATLQQFATGGMLKHGEPSSIVFTEALDREGLLCPLAGKGQFSGGVVFDYELSPGTQYRWTWPSRDPFPWNMVPVKVHVADSEKVGRTYKCQIEALFNIVLASREEMPTVTLLSNPELDRKMKASFSTEEAKSSSRHKPAFDLPEVYYVFRNLPENVTFRAKFVDSSGKEYYSKKLSEPRKKGTSGVIYTGEFEDLFLSMPPGAYKGELVLFTDPEGLYLAPESLSNVWSGSLTFPLEFKVKKRPR